MHLQERERGGGKVVGFSTHRLLFFSRCQHTLLGRWLRQHSYSWWKRNPLWIHVSDVKTLKCASCVICRPSWHLAHKMWSCIPSDSSCESEKTQKSKRSYTFTPLDGWRLQTWGVTWMNSEQQMKIFLFDCWIQLGSFQGCTQWVCT